MNHNTSDPSIHINVDPTNPGQFFACCGLLEIADRLWEGAEGWFESGEFLIHAPGSLAELVTQLGKVEMIPVDREDKTSSPIAFREPAAGLRLDWWRDDRASGRELKVWAGTMESYRIARAMQHALRDERFSSENLLDVGIVVRDPDDESKKVEPFYFDARRAPNAHSRDVGFSPNDLGLTTTAFPAVEFLCLIGLQRCLPARTDLPRVFDYHTWSIPIPPPLMPAAVIGSLFAPQPGFRFENWFRTGQRKHKAFRTANPLRD
jgi:CRISPR-associated protein Csb3